MNSKGLYEFGEFRLDLEEARLVRNGTPLSLPPKTYEVLVALVGRAERLVEKDVLLKEVWPDTFVEEANVSRHIWALRQALGDDALIETVPKRGYRFTAPARFVPPAARPDMVIERRTETRVVRHEDTVIEPAAAAPPAARRRALAWSGLAAAAVLVAAGLWSTRDRAAAGVRDAILVADFENQTGDPTFDDVVRRGLTVQLEQSPILRVAGDDRIRDTLRLMNRPANEPIRGAVAREVCQREGFKAMLSGSIAMLGSQYVMSFAAEDCQTGEPIAREQVTAATTAGVLTSLSDAAATLREQLGESLPSIAANNVPLARATTPSLEALKAYSSAMAIRERGGVPADAEALPLLKRAVELDPDFAAGHRTLAVAYGNRGELALRRHHAARAYELRDRTSDLERLEITALYHDAVTGDIDKSLEIYSAWKRSYPHDPRPANNAAVRYHNEIGDMERALSEIQEAVRRSPTNAFSLSNLAAALLANGRVDDAKAVLDDAVARHLIPPGHHSLYVIAFMRGDQAGMERELELSRGTITEARVWPRMREALAVRGQLRKWAEVGQQRAAASSGLAEQARVLLDVGRVDEARPLAARALAATPEPDDHVTLYVIADLLEPDTVREVIASCASRWPLGTQMNKVILPRMRATLAWRAGDPQAAVEELRVAAPYDYSVGGHRAVLLRALAYRTAGDRARAIGEFRKITDRRYRFATNTLYPRALVELARVYVEDGQIDRAMRAYDEVLAIWKDADPGLPLVEAARKERAALAQR
jgi:DNA-binding winged helix-turn-helix (wHTH) protein/tetratricopeptide (TPR) repeat protein